VRLLFARQEISADLSWDAIGPLLPGWQLATCAPAAIADHLDGVDVLSPRRTWAG